MTPSMFHFTENHFYKDPYKKCILMTLLFFVLIRSIIIKESTVRVFKPSVPYRSVQESMARHTIRALTYRTHASTWPYLTYTILGSSLTTAKAFVRSLALQDIQSARCQIKKLPNNPKRFDITGKLNKCYQTFKPIFPKSWNLRKN